MMKGPGDAAFTHEAAPRTGDRSAAGRDDPARGKKTVRELGPAAVGLLLGVTLLLVLLAGWHREMASRYPVADLPYVDRDRIEEQIRSGNVGRTEALYYRSTHAGSDTAEIR